MSTVGHVGGAIILVKHQIIVCMHDGGVSAIFIFEPAINMLPLKKYIYISVYRMR